MTKLQSTIRCRVASWLLCVVVTLASVVVAAAPVRADEGSGSASLKDLVIDKVYQLYQDDGQTVGFDPAVTDYTGTAYLSVNRVNVYPFTRPGVTATVNGQALKNGKAPVALTSGDNAIVVVTSGATTADSVTYTVTVNKVYHDYRGRTPIPADEVSATTDFGNPQDLPNMFDDDPATFWQPTELPKTEAVEGDGTGTSFVVDLGHTRPISRIRADFTPKNIPIRVDKIFANYVRISVTADETIDANTKWETPITQGIFRTEDQGVVRYELGVSHQARYLKFEIANYKDNRIPKINQFQIFEDPIDYPQVESPSPEMAVPHQNEAHHANIASGQATVIERGIPIAGWMPSGGYGRGVPTAKESEEFGWDGPLFYDPPFQNPDFMNYNLRALWGIAKAPFGGNGMESAGKPREFVDKSMLPYIRNAVSFCFGDEGNYSSAEAKRFGDWFAWSKEHYPGVITHSNQAGGNWATPEIMKEYMNIAKPDMLSYDDYYYDLESNLIKASKYLLNSNPLWNLQRQTALQGVDGTGRKPILFGQYLDVFLHDQPVSQKNLVANLSLLSGMKWLNFFRLEFQFDQCYLWDEDGTPTRGLFEWGEPLHNIKHISPQLTRLTNDWVMTQPGEGSEAATGWHMGKFGENPKKNAEFGISEVAAVNVGGAQSGKRGDVVLGYFNALPGLSEKELAANFNGATAPKAFMLLNGLVDGRSARWNDPNVADKEKGNADNTRQEITVTVNADHPTLYRVNKKTGAIEKVAIDENNTFTVSLGGGEAELYFWGIKTSASASSVAEGHSAAFAFDGDPGTYWQADDSAQGDSTLTNTFPLRGLNRVVLNEFGSAVTGFRLEYQAANGNWTAIPGPQGATIGDSLSLSFDEVQAQGIRLVITKSQGAPGIRELRVYGPVPPPSGPQTLTINDNTLGTGINRFSYEGKWSYRETRDGQGLAGLENQDVHFSNFKDVKATLTFYGTQVELKFRNNNANGHFTLQMDDGPTENFSTTGGTATISKTFSNLELGVHHLYIVKTAADQAAIDCAVVTYEGEIPADAPNADLQTYVDQTSKGAGKNQFEYDSTPTVTADRAPTGEDANWVEHTQDPGSLNVGWTGTSKANAAYTLHFYGTGVTLYAGENVSNSGPRANYGTIAMSLDGGEEQPVTYQNIGNSAKGNGNISVPVLHVNAADATKNAMHTLKIITKSGKNRIDYAVVSSLPETGGSSVGATYGVTVSVAGGGTYTMAPENGKVKEHEDAVITFVPEGGKRLASVIANGYRQELQGNQLYLLNVTADQTVSASFEPIPAPPVETTYRVSVSVTGGGTYTMTPESEQVTEHGDAVITFVPAENYRLASVTVNGQAQQMQGNQLSLSDITEDKAVSASFELISTPPVETTYRVTVSVTGGGTYTMTPESEQVTEHGSAVITFVPAENYRLASVTVNGQAQQMQGNQLSLSDITEDKTVSASFELISTPPTPPTPPTPTLPPQGTVTYPEDTAAPETPVTPDVIPVKQVAQEIKNSPEKSVTVELKGPAVANGDLFGAIRDTGKALTLAVKTPDGKLAYQWEFAGKDILYPQLSMNIGIQTEDALAKTGHSGMLLEYEHSGILPGGATVTVNVAGQFKDGAQLYYYYWTPASGVYEEVASGITVKDGMAKFPMTHCSAYLLTDQKIANAIVAPKPEKNPATGDRLPVFPGWMLLAAGVLLLTRRSLRKGQDCNIF